MALSSDIENSKGKDRAMVHAHGSQRVNVEILRPLAIALLSLVVAVVTPPILVGLLGIFVLWLAVVGVLVSAIVVSDVARRTMRRFAKPTVGALDRQAVGYPGR